MKVLYFDCFAGISGDMTLGALVDLGADRERIAAALDSLPVSGFDLRWKREERNGLAATRALVTVAESHHHRGLSEVLEIISAGNLSDGARARAEGIFRALAEAEAAAHGCGADEVHFHEVGALDAIVDVVGVAVAVDELAPETCLSSPVRVGHGTVRCAHGEYPIPAPATSILLKGVPLYAGEFEGEWTTPTGAAVLKTLASSFRPLPEMRVERIGFGAGSRKHNVLPNLLRVFEGHVDEGASSQVVVLELEIDDMNPQIFSRLHELLPGAGALDWYVTPVQMKKNRPGMLLTIISRPSRRDEIAEIIFRETTSIGYRYHLTWREELERKQARVQTPYGEIAVKLALRHGRVVNAHPEYEDCRRAAEQAGVPLKDVLEAAAGTFRLAGGKQETSGEGGTNG